MGPTILARELFALVRREFGGMNTYYSVPFYDSWEER